MKWFWIAVGVIAALVVAALVIGWLLPEKHTASRHGSFQASPEAVWALMTDVEKFPSWRSDVKAVERLPNRDGRPVWVEEGSSPSSAVTRPVCSSFASRILTCHLAAPGPMPCQQHRAAARSRLRRTEPSIIRFSASCPVLSSATKVLWPLI